MESRALSPKPPTNRRIAFLIGICVGVVLLATLGLMIAAIDSKFGDGAPFVLTVQLLPGQRAGKFHVATRAYISLPVYAAYIVYQVDGYEVELLRTYDP